VLTEIFIIIEGEFSGYLVGPQIAIKPWVLVWRWGYSKRTRPGLRQKYVWWFSLLVMVVV